MLVLAFFPGIGAGRRRINFETLRGYDFSANAQLWTPAIAIERVFLLTTGKGSYLVYGNADDLKYKGIALQAGGIVPIVDTEDGPIPYVDVLFLWGHDTKKGQHSEIAVSSLGLLFMGFGGASYLHGKGSFDQPLGLLFAGEGAAQLITYSRTF